MKPYTYLLILFFTVIICFIASFDKRLQFNKHFGAFLKAAAIVAVPFILWDVWFTAHGIWWFNFEYTIGVTLLGLPIEEWLFFVCIPFSCLFTYFCIDKFFALDGWAAFNNMIVFASIVVCSLFALWHMDKAYTFVTAMVLILSLIYLHFFARARWISQASMVYFTLMLGFFPVNGILTGTGLESPIVNYNPNEFMGIRMLSIPVEDAVYGYSQFLWIVYFFKVFQKKEAFNIK